MQPNAEELKRLKQTCLIPQKEENAYAIRIRSIGGDMLAEHLEAIAIVAERYGKGTVHVTTRQGMEIPGVAEEHLEAALLELLRSGINLGARGARVRTVTACPGAATCRNGLIDTKGLAEELDRRYFGKEYGKFKIAVAGCPNSCTKPLENDAGIMGAVVPSWNRENCRNCGICVDICPGEAIEFDGTGVYSRNPEKCLCCGMCIRECPAEAWEAKESGFFLYLGGAMGKRPRLGTKTGGLIPSKEELFRLLDRALEFYKEHAKKGERFGHTIDRLGIERVLKSVNR